MTVSPLALISGNGARNDALGSPLSSVSPFWIDTFTLGLLFVLYVYGDHGALTSVGYLGASVLAVWGALRSNAFYHYIVDTPRSRIVNAAQGFVELHGTCDLHGNRQTQGFLTGPPCVWHRYTIWSFNGAIPFTTGASTLPFALTDSTGTCIVNPVGAQIISSSRRTWIADGKRISSRYIHPGADIYVLGELRTHGGSALQYHAGIEVSKLLSDWKKDQRWLMEEFDRDGDGQIDNDEWDAARERAGKISYRLHQERAADPVDHVIAKPKNGMPFIISDRDPTPLGNAFRALGVINIVVAVACFAWFCLRVL